MKKLLVLGALFATASLSFGQGYVAFGNTSTTRVSTNGAAIPAPSTGIVGLTSASTVAGNPTYYYALLVAPTSQNTIDNSLAGWTFVGYGTNTSIAGRMSGNNSTDSSAVQVAGFGGTSTADFAVVGWSSSVAGSDFAAATAWWNNGNPNKDSTLRWFGVSTVANDIPLANAGGPYNSPWGSAANGQIAGLSLQPFVVIPEPGTFALAGLGAAAILIFRRRK